LERGNSKETQNAQKTQKDAENNNSFFGGSSPILPLVTRGVILRNLRARV